MKRAAIPPGGFVEDGRESAGGSLVRNRQRRRDWKHEQITRAERIRQKTRFENGFDFGYDSISQSDGEELPIERTAIARVPTEHGSFTAVSYVSKVDGIEHVAFVYGDHSRLWTKSRKV